MKSTRESNIELLRIVAMLMITIGHCVIHGLWAGAFAGNSDVDSLGWRAIQNVVFALCITGVNLFVFISGYFKIKLSLKRVLAFVLMCMTYNVLTWLSHGVVSGEVDLHGLFRCLIVTKTGNWFFKAYWWLMLFSPIINKAFDAFNLKETRQTLMMLVLLNCISGLVFCYNNSTGYNPSQLIFAYAIGAWIRKEVEEGIFQNVDGRKAVILWMLSTIAIAALAIYSQTHQSITVAKVYAYNNPLVLLSAVSCFLCFRTMNFNSKWINTQAGTVVGVLFIQECVFSPWTYSFIQEKYAELGDGLGILLYILLVLICIWIVGCFTEYIRKKATEPVVSLASDKISGIFKFE